MASTKTQIELMEEISMKLDVILGFLAAHGIENGPSAIIEKLYKMGLSARTIAPVVDLTENAVNIRLTRHKKKSSKKTKK